MGQILRTTSDCDL